MDSLRQLSSPTAIVIRNGESIPIPAKNVVPGKWFSNLFSMRQLSISSGDIVMVKVGDVVPADVCPLPCPSFPS